jgi:hypothetical protein
MEHLDRNLVTVNRDAESHGWLMLLVRFARVMAVMLVHLLVASLSLLHNLGMLKFTQVLSLRQDGRFAQLGVPVLVGILDLDVTLNLLSERSWLLLFSKSRINLKRLTVLLLLIEFE